MGASLAAYSDELAELVASVLPCTVSISGKLEGPGGGQASGSGFLIDDQGHAVTNHHVVDGLLRPLDARLPGGRRQHAEVVGVDKVTDLAVVRLEHPPAHHLSLREEAARLGELCLALGSPFGSYPESVTIGVVSGLARTIPQRGTRAIERALQTDAAINPGNSGGPLVDVRGRVLGVNQCTDARGEGISFAIPADTVRWISDELIAHGSVERAALGISVALRTVELDGQEVPRLAITRTKEGSSAANVLAVGDVILTINGLVVDERADLFDVLRRDRIGQPTPVEVLRDDRRLALEVVPARWEG